MVLFADHLFRTYAAGELHRRGLGPFGEDRPAAVA